MVFQKTVEGKPPNNLFLLFFFPSSDIPLIPVSRKCMPRCNGQKRFFLVNLSESSVKISQVVAKINANTASTFDFPMDPAVPS